MPTVLRQEIGAGALRHRAVTWATMAAAAVLAGIPAVSQAAAVGMVGDLQTLLTRLEHVLPAFWALLGMICYVSGLGFFVKGLLMFKAASTMGQQSRSGEFAGPLVYVFVGVMMLWIAPSTDLLSSTLFGNDYVRLSSQGSGGLSNETITRTQSSMAILGYGSASLEAQWGSMWNTIVVYVRFIGFIAFIRGWFIIAHAGQPGTQPGSISKGIVHLIGGILAINMVPSFDVIMQTIT